MKKIAGLLIIAIGSRLTAQEVTDKFVPVTQKDLNTPDPADWLMLGGNMEHWNYSPLKQINRENVNSLQLVWARQLPTTGGRAGTSPIIHNGMMYLISPNDAILAVDAVSGSRIWEYHIIANDILIAGGSCQNAPYGCYVTGHNITTGKELWRNEVIPHPDGEGDATWRGIPFANRWCTRRFGLNPTFILLLGCSCPAAC